MKGVSLATSAVGERTISGLSLIHGKLTGQYSEFIQAVVISVFVLANSSLDFFSNVLTVINQIVLWLILFYWLFRGSWYPGIEISLSLSGHKNPQPGKQSLIAHLQIKNSDRFSHALDCIAMRLLEVSADGNLKHVYDCKLNTKKIPHQDKKTIAWESTSSSDCLNLASSDSIHFDHIFNIESQKQYLVECVIFTEVPTLRLSGIKSRRVRKTQWKVSRAFCATED